jgi:hypothetical protein
MSSRRDPPASRAPLPQIAALLALATAATAALSFQLGAARAFGEASEQAAFALRQPILVARAGALAQAAAADLGTREQEGADLARLLDQIEAAQAALVLSAAAGSKTAPSAPIAPVNIDRPLQAFIADGRALAAAVQRGAVGSQPLGAIGAAEVARLADQLEQVASFYTASGEGVVRRQARLAMAAWAVVLMLSFIAVVAAIWNPAARTRAEPRRESVLRYEAMDRLAKEPRTELLERPVSVLGRALVFAREEGLREALCDRLGALGLAIEAAATQDEAMEAIESRRFGLFVVDSASVALARRIKAAAPRTACIAVSFTGESPRALRAHGADVVVTRPLLPMEIETAAAFAIGAIPARRQAA